MLITFHTMSAVPARWARSALMLLCAIVVTPTSVYSADHAKRTFVLPADDAEKSLKKFSEQSGRGIVVDTDMVKDVRTKAVRGEFTVREALDQMLVGTGLIAAHDETSGAFTVRRENANPNAEKTAQKITSDRGDVKKKLMTSGHLQHS